MEIELEKTYLLKYLPADLANFPFKEYIDIYLPTIAEHPCLRIRQKGQEYEITKKYPVQGKDSSKQYEFTISLTKDEFLEFAANIQGKRARKLRYLYKYNNIPAEIDIYQDKLLGLIIADFEFKTLMEMENFTMPEFCLIEVSQDKTMAGGMIVGKSYQDLKLFLDKKEYKPLFKY